MMRKFGLFLIALGLVFLTAAGSLYAWNRAEDTRAGNASTQALAAVAEVIARSMTAPAPEDDPSSQTGAVPPEEKGMTEVEIDGQRYIGRLTIPRLELELPILSEWNYDRLKIAPCRYSGTIAGENLVLLAHNYRKHFGPIRRLEPGDRVIFEDMDGAVFQYQVAATDVVVPTALEDVTMGIHGLTLITCTYGGQTRVIVSCDQIVE